MLWYVLVVVISSARSSLPPGHGKPLGSHNNLGRPAAVEEYSTMTPLHFYKTYVATRTPVILRGLAKTFPATKLWTDEYIRDNYGDLEVRLEAKTEKEEYMPSGEVGLGRATFREFLDRYRTDNMYCVSEIPEPMYKDLTLPGIMNCGGLKSSLKEMNMWINSGGAKSIIHKDAHNQLNCLLSGSKDWIFINNSYNHGIYQAEEIDGEHGGFSLINPDAVNYKTFPLFADVPWEYATVYGGDCLYLPPRYYHRVKSTNRNMAVSFLFGTMSQFEMDGCDSIQPALPLQDAQVLWKYPGSGMMSMGNSDPADVQEMFHDLLQDVLEESSVDKVTVRQYLDHVIERLAAEVPYIRQQFNLLFKDTVIFNDVEEIDHKWLQSLPYETWLTIAASVSFDPSNDPNSEFYYITKEEVMNSLKEATYYQSLDKDTFIRTYRSISGSLRIGRELFAALSKDNKTVTWYDVVNGEDNFRGYGREHDRGDGEMHQRNEIIKERAEIEMEETRKQEL